MRRAGITFLEVVVGVALLGIVTAAMLGTINFATGIQLRQARMLACSEVANRLVLEYLDDPTKLPDPGKTVEYGPPEAPACRKEKGARTDPTLLTTVARG